MRTCNSSPLFHRPFRISPRPRCPILHFAMMDRNMLLLIPLPSFLNARRCVLMLFRLLALAANFNAMYRNCGSTVMYSVCSNRQMMALSVRRTWGSEIVSLQRYRARMMGSSNAARAMAAWGDVVRAVATMWRIAFGVADWRSWRRRT